MKILLVDDDALITESLTVILSQQPDLDVVGTCENGQQAVQFIENNPVDVVLMDIRMPVMNGIDATAAIKAKHPHVKVLMLTTFRDFRHVHQSLHAGASGYLLKTDDTDIQLRTIRSVHDGQAIISEAALSEWTSERKDELLTPRENECMSLIAHGYSNKEIASRLYIGEGTVRNTISVILDKLCLRDRTQIAIYYWQMHHDA